MEWTFEVDRPVEADIVVPAGAIEVEPAEGSEVTVLLEAWRDSGRAEELISASEVSCTAGKVRVHVPERTFRNVEVRCRLCVPEGSALVTKTASADVRASISLRSFDGTTASGNAALRAVSGRARYKSASGEFACESVGGDLELRTASGDVSIRQTSGGVDIALASGDVHIGHADGPVDVRSASGDVRLDCVRRGRVRAQTASGDVTVGVAEGVGAYLDVTTVSGDTKCTLPFQDQTPGGVAALEIVARTVSGDIAVKGARR